jgi:coenzyme F420-reducing hydrogenase beta subunit
MLNKMVDRLLKHKWSPDEIRKYIGSPRGSWLLYASDEEVRKGAATGGTITNLLAYLLEIGEIDGALVCKSYVECNEVKTRYLIAKNRNELLSAQGSKYIDTDFSHGAVPLIKDFKGRLALVLLPCDTSVITRLIQNNSELRDKIAIKITLFCGHVSDPELTQLVVRKLKPAGVSLTDFRYRVGHWRGRLQASFEDGTIKDTPFSFFSDYQNLYFFCTRKCLQCPDHTGYESDISVGDVWLMSMKDNPIKHNAIIIRSEQAQSLLDRAITAGVLAGAKVPIEMICDAQSRSLSMHYNVTARARAARWFGIKIADHQREHVGLVDFIIALIIMMNYRLSNTASGRKFIYILPRPVIKIYLYLLKALEVF